MPRLPPLPPSSLSPDQSSFYTDLTTLTTSFFSGKFTTKTPDSSFTGPFGIFMHTPSLGRPFFAQMLALSRLPGLEGRLREVAILAVGERFGAMYEIYAHRRVARGLGVGGGLVESILKGARVEEIEKELEKEFDEKGEGDGKEKEAVVVVVEVVRGLLERKGPLDSEIYERAERVLGREGVIVLVQLVAFYASTCVLLNAFDVEVPPDDEV